MKRSWSGPGTVTFAPGDSPRGRPGLSAQEVFGNRSVPPFSDFLALKARPLGPGDPPPEATPPCSDSALCLCVAAGGGCGRLHVRSAGVLR